MCVQMQISWQSGGFLQSGVEDFIFFTHRSCQSLPLTLIPRKESLIACEEVNS